MSASGKTKTVWWVYLVLRDVLVVSVIETSLAAPELALASHLAATLGWDNTALNGELTADLTLIRTH